MSVRIDMLPAGHGDAIFAEWHGGSRVHRFLIDGGPKQTYGALKSRLQGVQELDLLTISHVDTDHIDGVVTCLLDPDLGFRARDIWFNGRNHVYHPLSRKAGNSYLGGVQGEVLSAILGLPGLSWNGDFDGRAVVVKEGGSGMPKKTIGDLTITLLSPRVEQLTRLERDWNRQVGTALQRLDLLPDDGSEADIANAIRKGGYETARRLLQSRYGKRIEPPRAWLDERNADVVERGLGDSSRANGSSIAFLVEDAASGTAVLFGADAHAKVLSTSVRQLLRNGPEERLRLDAFKLPHHGSKNNLDTKLLGRLDCERFLFSTDGSHGHDHPDDETIEMIVGHCKSVGVKPTLYFNYLSDRTEPWSSVDRGNGKGYRAVFPLQGRGEHGLCVRLGAGET